MLYKLIVRRKDIINATTGKPFKDDFSLKIMGGYQETQVYSLPENVEEIDTLFYLMDLFDELYPDFGWNAECELVRLNDK